MSNLKVYHEDKPATVLVNTNDDAEMARHLREIGVRFERWQAAQPVAAGAAQDVVLAAYRAPVDALVKECGYQTADVISLTRDNPNKAELRQKFLNEHIHEEDEVRFFADGRGLFYLHAKGKVYGVLCEKGDLISVPANTIRSTPSSSECAISPKYCIFFGTKTPAPRVCRETKVSE